MRQTEYVELEKLFLALGDKTRLRLLSLMAGGPVPVGELVDKTGESQPKVSRHLAYLRNCGLVATKRDGKWIYYAIDLPAGEKPRQVLQAVIATLGGGMLVPAAAAAGPERAQRRARPSRPQRAVPEPIVAEPDETFDAYDEPGEYASRPADEDMDVFLL